MHTILSLVSPSTTHSSIPHSTLPMFVLHQLVFLITRLKNPAGTMRDRKTRFGIIRSFPGTTLGSASHSWAIGTSKRLPRGARSRAGRRAWLPELKGSIGEGSNHSNFLDRSSVKILSKIINSRILNFRWKIHKFRKI